MCCEGRQFYFLKEAVIIFLNIALEKEAFYGKHCTERQVAGTKMGQPV